MSIAAVILETEDRDGDCVLRLGPIPPIDGTNMLQPTGQDTLVIKNPTWIPERETIIHGGDGLVIIESKPRRYYERIGYTRLREIEWPRKA